MTEPERPDFQGNNAGRDNNGEMISHVENMWVSDKEIRIYSDRPVPDRMRNDAMYAFAPPGDFNKASLIFTKFNLLILCGPGSGRTLAAVRLLIDKRVDHLQILDFSRPIDKILPEEVVPKTGYLWDRISSPRLKEMSNSDLDQLDDSLRKSEAFLVVTAENRDVLRGSTQPYSVELFAPSTEAVARAHLAADPTNQRSEDLLNKIDMKQTLLDYTAPQRGAQVAKLLLKVGNGYEFADIKADLQQRADDDVEEWFSTIEDITVRALAIAIAFLEFSSYGRVSEAAKMLEDILDNPENGDIWPYDPPNFFEYTRTDRLNLATAKLKVNEDLNEGRIDPELVLFTRPTWGERLLRYTWKEYERIRPILQTWLSDLAEQDIITRESRDRAMTRFGALLADSAEIDTIDWVRDWARSDSFNRQSMAAMTLNGLTKNKAFLPQVRAYLIAWSRPTHPLTLRTTAALICQGKFAEEDPVFVLSQVRKLAKNPDVVLKGQLSKIIRTLIKEPRNRSLVWDFLVELIKTGSPTAQRIARDSAIDTLGNQGLPLELDEGEQELFRALIAALVLDQAKQVRVIDKLVEWARRAETDPKADAGLTALLRTLLASTDRNFVNRLSFCLHKAIETRTDATPLEEILVRAFEENNEY
ncbi:hypothetical protein [Amycolatopsis sp.]|jgi:hypothetical protein|uniref:hypothetical protein n=1 Tax=Amycolatopsis sp. TaxID=37632 RepID=UPI002E00CE36|nr:hypothetical protein [Amycolatopsis sp.]